MKETKLNVRISLQEKERIKQYAADRKMSISELVRQALNYIIGGNKDDK